MKHLLLISFLLYTCLAAAQYAPQQGLVGSTAVPATSHMFRAWASACTVSRGFIDIANPSAGYVTAGADDNGTGIPDNSVVSLGDSGVATLTFPGFIYDAPGPDFAVFENAFVNPLNDSQAYIELAFVEVSSDGSHFFRFPAQSLTQNNIQVAGAGDYMYANLIHNLAGKYRGMWGTPFELNDLAPSPYLDIHHITFIRLVDVVGSITGHVAHDSNGRIINDPYPTNYPTGGFDLDAVGAMHHTGGVGVSAQSTSGISVYPNPATNRLFITITSGGSPLSATISSASGVCLSTFTPGPQGLDVSGYAAGTYFICILDDSGNTWRSTFTKL